MRSCSSTIRAQVASLGSAPQACSAACSAIWQANLGVVQGQSVPPAGLHFASFCIAYHKLVALVRDRPLGNGNRLVQTLWR